MSEPTGSIGGESSQWDWDGQDHASSHMVNDVKIKITNRDESNGLIGFVYKESYTEEHFELNIPEHVRPHLEKKSNQQIAEILAKLVKVGHVAKNNWNFGESMALFLDDKHESLDKANFCKEDNSNDGDANSALEASSWEKSAKMDCVQKKGTLKNKVDKVAHEIFKNKIQGNSPPSSPKHSSASMQIEIGTQTPPRIKRLGWVGAPRRDLKK